MKLIPGQDVVCWDCDDTLVLWDKQHEEPHTGAIEFEDPYDNQKKLYLKPHNVHLRIMRQYKGRGFTNIVWSAGGVEWAQEVIKRLKIEQYVDFVMTKPNRHFDDREDPQSIIGVRLYFKDKA